ncbi:hypothetical protein PWT90_05000 [Aphanocladium album]|nr:hypothetical protein PWT90_05000 [Aphanocladium album]
MQTTLPIPPPCMGWVRIGGPNQPTLHTSIHGHFHLHMRIAHTLAWPISHRRPPSMHISSTGARLGIAFVHCTAQLLIAPTHANLPVVLQLATQSCSRISCHNNAHKTARLMLRRPRRFRSPTTEPSSPTPIGPLAVRCRLSLVQHGLIINLIPMPSTLKLRIVLIS